MPRKKATVGRAERRSSRRIQPVEMTIETSPTMPLDSVGREDAPNDPRPAVLSTAAVEPPEEKMIVEHELTEKPIELDNVPDVLPPPPTTANSDPVTIADRSGESVQPAVENLDSKSEVDEIKCAIENFKIESEPVQNALPQIEVPGVAQPPPEDVAASVASTKQVKVDDPIDISSASNLDFDYGEEDDSMSIRRSSRIKTISKTKQKSRGHGLVRDKEKIKLPPDSGVAVVDQSSSAEPPMDVSAAPARPSEELKPQKIKSRWLDSAKRDSLDLNNSLAGTTSQSVIMPVPAPTAAPAAAAAAPAVPVDYFAPDPEVIECLKKLNQIRDNIYNCEKNISKEAKKMVCDCFLTAEEKQAGEFGCGEDCLNRLLMIECGPKCIVGERCTNRRFQGHQYAPVVVFKTEKKGFGLRAADDIQCGEFIMEYVGEVLNAKQFDKRANAYSKDKNIHYYFMALRSDAVIDATIKGNISRFINHSCDPNAETQKWTVNGELRIGFFTTRAIAAGEEVTFDYQYQRYGKEAQKCFCEAETCRGWIGEEPESDDEEEDGEEEESDADDEESGAEAGGAEDEEGESGEGVSPGEKAGKAATGKGAKKKGEGKKKPRQRKAKATVPKAAKKAAPKKPRKTARSRRQEILDDLDLDAEIDTLSGTGLKNQAHTLKLSRLMVRAKLPKTRMRLLGLIQEGEMPCRRLFLDYHGLRLLHGWMTDAQELKDLELKRELLRTLDALPIPNKTLLKDSHVLASVCGWGGLKLDNEMKEIVGEQKVADLEVVEVKEVAEEQVKEEPMDIPEEEQQQRPEAEASEAKAAEEAERCRVRSENEMRIEMRRLCREMVTRWVQLPEVFRIPKKERIEQMKEHEREADQMYTALAVQNEEEDQTGRYKSVKQEERFPKREFKKMQYNDGMSKMQRRHLFAMKVEEQRRIQQRTDAWQHHEFRCNFFGLDPVWIRPEDVPSWVDLETRQWFAYDLTEVPTPPSYSHVTMKPPNPPKADINDYDLPTIDLPEGWEYAMDPRGRLFYFHKKIRIPQWEVPIKLLPLNANSGNNSDGRNSGSANSNGMEMENGHYDRNDDSSTTDTCDSSEEEMVKRINRIKKLQKVGVPRSTIVKLHLHERNSDDEVTKEEVNKAEGGKPASLFMGDSRKLPNKEALVEYREISPRREEDRLYGQQEMKRYKETKEKFKLRKEMLKRRKLDKMVKAGLISTDPEKRMSLRGIQITDDELYGETDDEAEEAGSSSAAFQMNGDLAAAAVDLPATMSDPLMEKVVLGNSRVDELDEPHKYNEMTRLKIRERNAKRSRALKVQMKLKKMKMDEEHGEGAPVNGMSKHGTAGDHHHHHQNGVVVTNGGDPRLSSDPRLSRESREIHSNAVIGGAGGGVAGGTEKAASGPSSGSSSHMSSDKAKRIKDKFRSNIAGVIVHHLSPYRRDSCQVGRITNNEDFKHLAKKLTHFVMVKELKHCATVADLTVSDSVKQKTKEFIRKYMTKWKVYEKPDNEPEY